MPTAGKVAAIYAGTGAAVAMTDEATTADATKKRYTVTAEAKRYIPLDAAVTVKVNGSAVTTGYTVERAGGVIVFATALTTEAVTVTSTYVAVAAVGGMYAWKGSFEAPTQEDSDFACGGYESHASLGVVSGKVSCSRYFQNTGADLAAIVGNTFLLKCFIDTGTSKTRYEGWAVLTSDSIDADPAKLIDESLDAVFTGGFYYREG
jgi:hypothetical protein